METLLYIAGAIVAVTGALFALTRVAAGMRKTGKRWEDFLDDWHGTPARPGRPKIPGVMERMVDLEEGLQIVKHELFPNSGASLRDAVNRLESELKLVKTPVESMAAKLDTSR